MITIVAHDAGGAEVLSSYVRRNDIDCNFVLEGPAVKIFKRKLGNIEIISLDEAMEKSEWILCGSSIPAEFELNAIKKARLDGKHSVVFLDHWINYQERFARHNFEVLPDEIWVGDSLAKELAEQIFPDIDIRLVNNPYFEDIQQDIKNVSLQKNEESDNLTILFVSQPLGINALNSTNRALNRGYTEEEALRYFLNNVHALGKPVDQIIIRPHPSEDPGKYEWANEEFSLPIVLASGGDLLEVVSKSDVVVGMDSMAMVVGLLAGKRVICSIPPGGKPCRLPHSEIQTLSQVLICYRQAAHS
ncbi:MAG: hypothetical protein RPS47_12330 [Colwellia sp.]|jgi:hypothetical protein